MPKVKYPAVEDLDDLLTARVGEGELTKEHYHYLKKWMQAEALLMDQGGDRTKIIALFYNLPCPPQK